jgi:hypothetical protein
MTGVPRDVAEHTLNTYRSMEPIVQKKRSMAREWHEAVVWKLKTGAGRNTQRSQIPDLSGKPGCGEETRWLMGNVNIFKTFE